jgi:hypothetical protein
MGELCDTQHYKFCDYKHHTCPLILTCMPVQSTCAHNFMCRECAENVLIVSQSYVSTARCVLRAGVDHILLKCCDEAA